MIEPDDEERQLRIELMIAQIDHARLNIEKIQHDLEVEQRRYTRQFALQLVSALAAAMAAGAAIFGLILHLTGRL
jgi:hypothetical protein